PAGAAAAARRWLSPASASWSAREIPKSAATFSAVTPMWQSSKGSVSAPTMASTVTPSRIRWPHRSPGSQYWPRLIDSAPPATAALVPQTGNETSHDRSHLTPAGAPEEIMPSCAHAPRPHKTPRPHQVRATAENLDRQGPEVQAARPGMGGARQAN